MPQKTRKQKMKAAINRSHQTSMVTPTDSGVFTYQPPPQENSSQKNKTVPTSQTQGVPQSALKGEDQAYIKHDLIKIAYLTVLFLGIEFAIYFFFLFYR